MLGQTRTERKEGSLDLVYSVRSGYICVENPKFCTQTQRQKLCGRNQRLFSSFLSRLNSESSVEEETVWRRTRFLPQVCASPSVSAQNTFLNALCLFLLPFVFGQKGTKISSKLSSKRKLVLTIKRFPSLPKTLNGIHSPNTPSNTNNSGGSHSFSSTPSPPNSHTGGTAGVGANNNNSGTAGFTSKSTASTVLSSSTTTSSVCPPELSFSVASSNIRQINKLKRFLSTLYQFTCDISPEVGERVHSLIIGLVNSTLTVEEFHQKIQEVTHYPLRPYVVPFLRLQLPILQNEIMHYARLSKLTPAQYIRQHESLILESAPPANASYTLNEPFDIFQPHENLGTSKEGGKRRPSPEIRKENGFNEPVERERLEGPTPAKRHQPIPSPTLASRLSPGNIAPALLHTPSGHSHSNAQSILHTHLANTRNGILEESQREKDINTGTNLYHLPGVSLREPVNNGRVHSTSTDHFTDRYPGLADRYEKEFLSRQSSAASLYSELHRTYNDDIVRDMEDEWKNIYTMLNCILGMVDKTKRALSILQQRSMDYAASSIWPSSSSFRTRHFPPPLDHNHATEFHELKKSREHLLSAINYSKSQISTEVERMAMSDSVRRVRQPSAQHIEEAVNEVKRQAVAELQKAVSAAETKATELVAAERAKMERMLSEARRHAAEDALAALSHQEDSTENCWNCGRKASETCSGCNTARYCGAFCQHKDWENHHRLCGQTRENSHSNTSIPSTISDVKRSKGRSPTPPSNNASGSNNSASVPRSTQNNTESKEKSCD